MVYGIFVDEIVGAASDVRLVSAQSIQCNAHQVPTIHPGNFNPSRITNDQLQLAGRIARGVSNLRLGRDVLLPFLGGPFVSTKLGLVALLIALAGLVLCLLVSTNQGYLDTPLAIIFPAWPIPANLSLPAFVLGYILLLGGLYFPLPWRIQPCSILAAMLAILRFSRNLRSNTGNRCLVVNIENANDANVRGNSAGFAFFCACVSTIFQDRRDQGKDWLIPLWGRKLLEDESKYAVSVGLTEAWALQGAGRWQEKLAAIVRYNQTHQNATIEKVFCPDDDLEKVGDIHRRHHGQHLRDRPERRSGCHQAKTQWGFKVIACPHIPAFIQFVNPWKWWRLALRSMALAVPVLTLVVVRPTLLPEFTIECAPHPCLLIHPGIHYAVIPSGESDSVHIEIVSRGSPGPLVLGVESNYDETLSLTLDGESRKQFSLTMAQDSELFFFAMPYTLPSGEVVVVVAVQNKAGKWSQTTIFFALREASSDHLKSIF